MSGDLRRVHTDDLIVQGDIRMSAAKSDEWRRDQVKYLRRKKSRRGENEPRRRFGPE